MSKSRKRVDRSEPDQEQLTGLTFKGTVIKRGRKTFGNDEENQSTKIIYQCVDEEGQTWYIQQWKNEDTVPFEHGEQIHVKIRIEPFTNRKGIALYALTIDDGARGNVGDEF